jgi:2'-5' RNA ligase
LNARRRLFFALWPDETTRAQLSAACTDVAAASGGRPVEPAHYHLTLAFLGSVPGEAVPEIRRLAARVEPAGTAVCLDRFGYFARAGVLWLGASSTPPALGRLAEQIRQRMQVLGLPADEKPFRPHVTIARKVPDPPRNPVSRTGGAGLPVVWPIREFVLVDSVTDPAGARYEVLERFPPCSR